MKLPAGTTSGRPDHAVEKVLFLQATVGVYYPSGDNDGFTTCNAATCVHRHPDTREGAEQMRECGERMARIIGTGRVPKWATLTYPV